MVQYVEDDCKVFKDTRGFHMTEESCMERVHEKDESLKDAHSHFEEEISMCRLTAKPIFTSAMTRQASGLSPKFN